MQMIGNGSFRRAFEQGRSHVLLAAADPAASTLVAGDVWFKTTGNQMCVYTATGTKRSAAFT
jgi:hypothetical protein